MAEVGLSIIGSLCIYKANIDSITVAKIQADLWKHT